MVVMVVVVVVMVVGMWGVRMGMFAIQHCLAGINLGDLALPATAVGAVAEAGEGTVVHGIDVLGVGDARHGVVVPVEVARLDGRLEPGEHLQVHLQGAGVLVVVGLGAGGRVATLAHLFQDLHVPRRELEKGEIKIY